MGVSASVHAGIHTPRADNPLGRHPLGRHPNLGRHPLPGADTPPPQQTATAANGTHPPGMHSCLLAIFMRVACKNNILPIDHA